MLNTHENISLMMQNHVIDTLNNIINKSPANDDTLLCAFRSLSNIALDNEEYRKICVEKNCVDFINASIAIPRDLIVTEGKLAIQNILKKNFDIPDDEPLKPLKSDELITKEMRNFLISGKIWKLYIIL